MQYWTEWRMTLARDHLRADDLSLAQIADTIGYGSPLYGAWPAVRNAGSASCCSSWPRAQTITPLGVPSPKPCARWRRCRAPQSASGAVPRAIKVPPATGTTSRRAAPPLADAVRDRQCDPLARPAGQRRRRPRGAFSEPSQ